MTMKLEFQVYGLACGGGGARTVERGIGRVEGVRNAYVNPATGTAYVDAADHTDPAAVVTAVRRAGFRAGPVRSVQDAAG